MSTKRKQVRARGDGSNIGPWVLGTAALFATVCLVWFWNSKSFPEVSSGESLRLIKALYTACSSKSDKRLAQVEKELTAIETQGKLTEAERDAFDLIITHARAGDWLEATSASYAFAADQIR
jgi:hypothetical protein